MRKGNCLEQCEISFDASINCVSEVFTTPVTPYRAVIHKKRKVGLNGSYSS